MSRLLASPLLVGVIVFCAASARAQSDNKAEEVSSRAEVVQDLDRQARLHFETGTALFESGEYERATEEFTEAYRLSNRPALLFNMALSHERLGHLQQAVELLRAYLQAVPETPKRGRLELRIQRMEERLEAQRSEEAKRAEADRSQPAPTQEQAAARSFSFRSMPVLTTASVAVVGGVVLAVFGPLALSERDSLRRRCSPDCTDSQVRPLRTYTTTADVGLGLMAAAVVAAAIWIPLDLRRERHTEKSAIPAVALGPTTAALRWSY